MATIKLKFRPSTVQGREGTLYFQIIHQRQVRQIYTELHIRDNEWNMEEASVLIPCDADMARSKYLLSINESLGEQQAKLHAIISHLESKGVPYNALDVVRIFHSPQTVVGVVSFIRKLIDDMRRIGKRPMERRLVASLNSLLRYTDGKEVDWKDVTSTFVLGYEEYLIKRGLCRNSTSFYMRNLRSIVNKAIELDYNVPRNLFRHVYMRVDKTQKRAVTLDTVRMIRDIDLSAQPSLDFARKVFMFAFYTRGMSFVDIAFLKKSDLHNGVISYSRRKTRQQLHIKVEPEIMKIIENFGNNDGPYLLPIITEKGESPEAQYENAYYRVNRNIQKVGRLLGLETKLTLYVARHAWASIALSNNVAVSTISKAMGHDSEKTTIIYLRTLDSTAVDKANSDIIRLMDSRKRKR
ncbi:MAG: site-specific integrase [Muribaculaceae bacterium]|nr:site-specific integrase [Muribaculaceae bacterium]